MNWINRITARLKRLLADLEQRNFAFAVLVAAARAFNLHHCTHLAAGIAYYAIFSLFPLLLGLIAIASLFLHSANVQDRIIAVVSELLPVAAPLVQRNIEEVLIARGTIGFVAAAFLLWSAKAVFGAITTALNLAWEVKETRPFWRLTGIQMILVLGVGAFIAASLALTSLLAIVSTLPIPLVGSGQDIAAFWTGVAELISLAFSIVAFLLMYRFLPCALSRFRDVWPGAVLAGVLFEIAKAGYVVYFTRLTRYSLVYGSLSAVIALLFWAWLSGVILLFGAEVSAQYMALRKER